jgi:large subunit ribosomal protein L4e
MARLHGTSPHLHFRASLVPQAVGGRRAHPPKAEKIWEKKINKKERRLAIASAIAGTANPDVVASRGHIVAGLKLPLVIVDDVQKISKTAELASFFERIGLLAEMQRVSKKKIRAGKGKMRGRKYKRKVGPLIVITEDKGIVKATSNLPGFDTILVKNLNVEALSPGAHGARLTLYTESAIKELEKYPVM